MSKKATNFKDLILEYLLDEGLLREKIKSSDLDFGYQFTFPPGNDPSGRPLGKTMVVFRPKNKDILIVEIGTQISQPHIQALDSLKPANKKLQFFMDLRKFFLLKDVFYHLDIQNHRYKISDQIFLQNNKTLSKNSFYKRIRKVFNAAVYSNIILDEYCRGKVKPEDLKKDKDFSSGPGFSLYS